MNWKFRLFGSLFFAGSAALGFYFGGIELRRGEPLGMAFLAIWCAGFVGALCPAGDKE